ncbi:transporter substrate-binding domain-containing protein [Paucilactobacillus kaifaensis]|uniref:transporter substrate-binding domain-containing protein n=1 Tax=Paucilactobacillus kaifaensis TaxID=2559921 RepID=UPI0010F9C649|nr:transporter substrate-binding domain-containing protein [Paucilactobacillus kaifaensis]
MKKWIKGIGIFALGLLLVVTLTACGKNDSSSNKAHLKTSGTLTIGLEGTFAPYSYRENGKLTGFEVELGKAIAKKADLKAKFVPTKWDSLIAGVGDGKFDVALNNITITKARQKKYAFSTPYIYSRTVLITKKDNTDINSVNDIKGKKIAVGTGTDNAVQAEKYGAKILPSSEFSNTLALIEQGRAEGTLNSREALLSYLKDNPNADLKYKLVPTSKIQSAKIAALIAKDNPGLTKKVNKALKELRADGTLEKLSDKYFTSNITEK